MNESEKAPNTVGGILFILLWIICVCACIGSLAFAVLIRGGYIGMLIHPLYILVFCIGNIAFSFTIFKSKDVRSIFHNALFNEKIELNTYKKDISILKICQKLNIYLGIILSLVVLLSFGNAQIEFVMIEILFRVIGSSLIPLIYFSLINLFILLPIELKLKQKAEKFSDEVEEGLV